VPDGLPRRARVALSVRDHSGAARAVTIIHELNHQVRVVAMDKVMPTVRELTTFPFYNGTRSVISW